MLCRDCNAAPEHAQSGQCLDCFDARYLASHGGRDALPGLGTWDLGYVVVEMVMTGITYDRGEAVPVCLVDVPGRGMIRLRGHAVTYWEASIDDLFPRPEETRP